MFIPQEKAKILAEYYRTRSVTEAQRWVQCVLHKESPNHFTIFEWDRLLQS